MHALRHSGPSRPARLAAILAVTLALIGLVGVAPASADVYDSCTIARCDDAVEASEIWADMGYPTNAGWYDWPDGQSNYTGGTFQNREGQLPSDGTYNEYDVYSRSEGASRDAYRIVVDRGSGDVWFSPNHYTDFYHL